MIGLISGTYNSAKDTVLQIKNQRDDAIKAQSSDFTRGARAWDVYKAIDGSQYEEKKRRVFKEDDRKPWQFDFASAKADTLAGAIVAELPDPEFSPTVGEPNILTEAVQESYFHDKDLFNYSFVLLETIRDGCVHSGWCEIGTSKKYNPAGNINLTRIRRGYFIPDQYWMTSDDNDLEVAYKIGYYNADQLKRIWRAKSDDIDRAVFERKIGRLAEAPENRQIMQLRQESRVGDEWCVTEKHFLDIKNTIRLIGLKQGTNKLSSQLAWIPFPVTERRETLERFATHNDIDWETVQEVPFEQRIHKVITISDISDDLILFKGDGAAQCNSLPFLHYTTSRVDGHDKGIVESIADLQEMFNERMVHIHQMIAKASGGSSILNEELVPNAKDRQRISKNLNKPGHHEFLPLDDVKNAKLDVGAIQVNPAIFQQVSVIYNELLPLISRVSDTMSAMSNSEDTGVLFEKKYQMNKISNILFEKFAKQLINNLGEKYFYQWQHTYASAERRIPRRGGGEIILNRDTGHGIINSVAQTPRCRVIVNENFSSATYQMRQRMQIQDVIRSIPPDDYLRMNEALGIYFNSIPMGDQEKVRMDMVTEKNNIKAEMRFMTEMSGMMAQMGNNKVLIEQANQMLSRMKQPAMGAGGDRGPQPDMMTPNAELPSVPPPQMEDVMQGSQAQETQIQEIPTGGLSV